MAVQQSQANEQLEALHTENTELHKAITQLAEERDRARKAYVQLQLQTLSKKAMLDADTNALRMRCLQAEAEVIELKGTVDKMKQRTAYRENPTITSAAMKPLSFPTISGLGSGLTTHASPQLGRRMSGLGVPQVPTLPPAGRGVAALFPGPVTGPAGSTLFASPRTGSGRAGWAPEASAVTTGASSTTTDQDPAQAGSRPSPR